MSRQEKVGWTKPTLDTGAKPCKNEQHIGSIKLKPTAPKVSNKLTFLKLQRINCKRICRRTVGSEEDLISKPRGGVLDISLGGEVRPGSSYPDPV